MTVVHFLSILCTHFSLMQQHTLDTFWYTLFYHLFAFDLNIHYQVHDLKDTELNTIWQMENMPSLHSTLNNYILDVELELL